MQRVSSSGHPYLRWIPNEMPRIPDNVIEGSFFLYPTAEDARNGTKAGGTGFYVVVPMESDPDNSFLYAVSNWHVVHEAGCSVMRINTINGVEIRAFDPSDWHFDSRYDIAVIPLHGIDFEHHKITFTYHKDVLTHPMMEDLLIGIGDGVFMIGRFIDHDGVTSNIPAARFGHLSIMLAPIQQGPLNQPADCFYIDLHSRTGFSGSPVFVYSNDYYEFLGGRATPRPRPFVRLLGIHVGQFPEMWELSTKSSTGQKQQIRGMSGMTYVLPAWNIYEVLGNKELVEQREEIEKAHNMKSIPAPEIPTEEDSDGRLDIEADSL